MTPVRLEPAAPRSRVKHSTTEPLCSLVFKVYQQNTLADGPKGHLNCEYIFHFGLIQIRTVCLSVGITELVLIYFYKESANNTNAKIM